MVHCRVQINSYTVHLRHLNTNVNPIILFQVKINVLVDFWLEVRLELVVPKITKWLFIFENFTLCKVDDEIIVFSDMLLFLIKVQ